MKNEIDFKKINFETYEEYYEKIINLKAQEIIITLNEMIIFEDETKGIDFEDFILKFIDHKNKKIRFICTKYLSNSTDIASLRKIRKIITHEKDNEIKSEAIIIFGYWVSDYVAKNKQLLKLAEFGMNFINSTTFEEHKNLMIQSLSFIKPIRYSIIFIKSIRYSIIFIKSIRYFIIFIKSIQTINSEKSTF